MSLAQTATQLSGCVIALDEVESTNTWLVAALAQRDWPLWTVVTAEHQTAGKGRLGRTWQTPRATALTMTVLTPPLLHLGWAPLLAGLAVHDVLSQLGATPTIKWPNDVLLPAPTAIPGWGSYRKVAGILCEATEQGICVGIGINVTDTVVPHAIALKQGGIDVTRDDLAAAVLAQLAIRFQQWHQDESLVRGDFEQSCLTLGSQVEVDTGSAVFRAEAKGITAAGALEVVADGKLQVVLAGDVSVRL